MADKYMQASSSRQKKYWFDLATKNFAIFTLIANIRDG